MATVWLLGIVQGLTEFLPVSSSGHLVLLQAWFHVDQEGAMLAIFLHMGTLGAIVLAYPGELAGFLAGLGQRRRDAWREAGLLIFASLPAAAAGLLLNSVIQQFFTPLGASVGWLATTALLWRTPPPETGTRRVANLSTGEALAVGAMQALALWPGLSRSGSTIFMARKIGLSPHEATRFSFWMAIPAILGAGLVNLPGAGGQNLPPGSVVGAALALATGFAAIRWLNRSVTRPMAFRGLARYTLVLAAVAFITARLHPGG